MVDYVPTKATKKINFSCLMKIRELAVLKFVVGVGALVLGA